ncbi:hypothetical protein [Methanosarcina lacustris]|uniref:hypothetical protein n=1 Tax=Methanosarcina lacustris TaxID=170861 RepID=UPI00064F85AE|nr:hypothetical protein [Methanosarcina lacustris]
MKNILINPPNPIFNSQMPINATVSLSGSQSKKGDRKKETEKGRQKKGDRKKETEKGRQKKGDRKRETEELKKSVKKILF